MRKLRVREEDRIILENVDLVRRAEPDRETSRSIDAWLSKKISAGFIS